jgi:hypothetical protein
MRLFVVFFVLMLLPATRGIAASSPFTPPAGSQTAPAASAAPAAAQTPQPAQAAPKTRYEECSGFAATDPQKALILARDWEKTDRNDPSALHCEAMALYAQRDFFGAELRLLALATRLKANDPRSSVMLSEQAAQAALSGKNTQHAENALTDALALATQRHLPDLMPELLQQRAQVFLLRKEPYKAMQDAEAGLSLSPDNTAFRDLHRQAMNMLQASLTPPKPKPKPAHHHHRAKTKRHAKAAKR